MGKAPAGWLGPDFRRVDEHAEPARGRGIRYVCDWSNDEQPYKMKVPQGELYSVGVDAYLTTSSSTGRPPAHRRSPPDMVVDNFDGLYRDGAKNGRLMVVNVHPWVMGWPWRSKYTSIEALAHISKQPMCGRRAAVVVDAGHPTRSRIREERSRTC